MLNGILIVLYAPHVTNLLWMEIFSNMKVHLIVRRIFMPSKVPFVLVAPNPFPVDVLQPCSENSIPSILFAHFAWNNLTKALSKKKAKNHIVMNVLIDFLAKNRKKNMPLILSQYMPYGLIKNGPLLRTISWILTYFLKTRLFYGFFPYFSDIFRYVYYRQNTNVLCKTILREIFFYEGVYLNLIFFLELFMVPLWLFVFFYFPRCPNMHWSLKKMAKFILLCYFETIWSF